MWVERMIKFIIVFAILTWCPAALRSIAIDGVAGWWPAGAGAWFADQTTIVACSVDYDCVADSLLGSVVAGDGDFSCCYFGYSTVAYERADLASVNCGRCCECPKIRKCWLSSSTLGCRAKSNLTWACAKLWWIAESDDVRRQLDSGGLRYAVLLLLYGDVSMFLLLDLIGPPPTLRPKNTCIRNIPRSTERHSPLDSLDDALPSPEFEFLVISFEYPGVVNSPAKVFGVASSWSAIKRENQTLVKVVSSWTGKRTSKSHEEHASTEIS